MTVHWDDVERAALCDDLERLGPDAPTLLPGWTAADLAAHLVQREHDPLAAPTLVLPVRLQRFADRRRDATKQRDGFERLVARIRSGPPPGLFRVSWVRATANLNELFVHHEDLLRANGSDPRDLAPGLDDALWRAVRVSGRYLTRRVRGAGVTVVRAGTMQSRAVRRGAPVVEVVGAPGELLLLLFGRQDVAVVDLRGPAEAVAAVRGAHLGM